VGYAGNLGRAHHIETVLEAMKALYNRSIASPADETAKAIRFLFVGGGALRPRLEAEATASELNNVQFHGYQPREQLASTLCAADIHLVLLNPKLEGFIVPSKLYAIAAAGRPVIFIGDRSGEIARVLSDVGCGFTVAPYDVTGLQNRILQFAQSPALCRMMGVRARAAFERHWDKDIAVDRWERLLTSARADSF
jgi:glycosyltransferase involved in cell wall biosynthesis